MLLCHFVWTIVMCCIWVWISTLSRLQLVQDSASLLTGTKGREHITPVWIKLHWLPVWYRIHYTVLLYVFRAVHGLSPDYVTDLISVCQSSRYLRSNYQLLLMVPRSRLKCRDDRAFSVAAPRLYLSIRSSPTVGVFQSALKTFFISFYFIIILFYPSLYSTLVPVVVLKVLYK